MTCCPRTSAGCSASCRCSPAGSPWPRWPRCAAAGTRRPRWTWWTSWPASRWWSPSPPRAAPGTGCWRPSASTPPGAWPRRARPSRPGAGTPRRSCSSPRRNASWRCWLREQDNFRAALDFTLSGGDPAGPRLARALGGFWLARGLFHEAQGWLERALAAGPADERLRADLHPAARERCCMRPATWSGPRPPWPRARRLPRRPACPRFRPGSGSCRRKSRLVQERDLRRGAPGVRGGCGAAGIRRRPGGRGRGVAVGRQAAFLRGVTPWLPNKPSSAPPPCARQSGNHHAERESRTWLVANLQDLPIPVDVAVGRAEQLLEAAAGDPWAEAAILQDLALLYGYAGRFADARAAYRRCQSDIQPRPGRNSTGPMQRCWPAGSS